MLKKYKNWYFKTRLVMNDESKETRVQKTKTKYFIQFLLFFQEYH